MNRIVCGDHGQERTIIRCDFKPVHNCMVWVARILRLLCKRTLSYKRYSLTLGLAFLVCFSFGLVWFDHGNWQSMDIVYSAPDLHLNPLFSKFATTTRPRSNVTLAMLLSYQRTGSSYVGFMFSDPRDTFNVFEPLDPLYCAMFGTSVGYNVPSDIFSLPNGNLRNVTIAERKAAYWAMNKIYRCEMSSLPPAMLAHPFWDAYSKSAPLFGDYASCLKSKGVNHGTFLDECRKLLRGKCGKRFGEKSMKTHDYCQKYLWRDQESTNDSNDFVPRCSKNRRPGIIETGLPIIFTNYYKCLAKIDAVLTHCASEYLDKPCKTKSLRVIKTVRSKMSTAADFLAHYDNFYLMHVFRDPRGAVKSRRNALWSQGAYISRRDWQSVYAKEATLYCSQVLDDVHLRIKLENDGYKARIKQVIYDKFVQGSVSGATEVYNFLGKPVPGVIIGMYRNHTVQPYGTVNSNKTNEEMPYIPTAKKWESTLNDQQLESINNHCKQFLQELNFS